MCSQKTTSNKKRDGRMKVNFRLELYKNCENFRNGVLYSRWETIRSENNKPIKHSSRKYIDKKQKTRKEAKLRAKE